MTGAAVVDAPSGHSSRAIEVVDVAPRDGLQNEEVLLSTAVKAELVGRLVGAGLRRVEVTSFVSPARVPAMADAEDLMARLRSTGGPAGVSFIGLVLNQRGVERAVAAGVDEINAVVVATDTFNRRNQGATTAESIAEMGPLVGAAREAGLRVGITIGAAFGCPFEGEVALARLVEVARALADLGIDELALADSIGVAVPIDVAERVAAVREVVGPSLPLRCHFHNTRNTGIANAAAAVDAGVAALDASLGGIGGCPFAPAATGNIATEDLVYLLDRTGVPTGVSLDRLIEGASWLGEQLGRTVPGMVSRAGRFPRA
ncbi:MAG: hydroxymethylglutaryl-CoA lyase [Acidimicrobiales bacterium]